MSEFEVLVTANDWLNRPDRGTLVLVGLSHDVLLAAVEKMSPDDYEVRYDERFVSTGAVDEDDKPVKKKKIIIT